MELIFQGGGEMVKMVLNRESKQLVCYSSKTNYQPQKLPWKMLFDKGKETVQERITDRFNDDEFKTAVVHSMSIAGYRLKNKSDVRMVELPEQQ